MAIRVTAATTYLSHLSISVPDDAFTIMGWFYLTTDRNATGVLMQCLNAGGTRYKVVNLATSSSVATSPQ
jgi:hypothetical protein